MALRGFDALVAREIVEEEPPFEVVTPDAELPPVAYRDPATPALQPFATEDAPAPTPLIKSEIAGVSDEKWTDFVRAMRTAQTGSVSAANQLGAFEMRPRRLEDLGLMRKVKFMRSPTGALTQIGEWVPPLTQERFLSSPRAQYLAFVASMKRYVEGLRNGTIKRPEGGVMKGTTLSGILAILHRCGVQGFQKWNDPEKRFENTVELVAKVNGIF